ncbi:MAG: hypothetical protein WA830_08215 [Candidatus Sulfotelmatobacter sp.]
MGTAAHERQFHDFAAHRAQPSRPLPQSSPPAHHGSENATTPELVASARPQFAIISVGSGNSFGLRRTDVLGRLADAGARLYRTDLDGAVTFYLDGHAVTPSVAVLQ